MKKLLFGLLTISIFSNCSSSSSGKTYRMSKDSELTLLMREMYSYYDSIKVEVGEGKLTHEVLAFKEIHKAKAAEPKKSSSDLYKAMANVYIRSVDDLNEKGSNKMEQFNLMVDNCMNCHKQMCPGPMIRIKKLYIK